MIRMKWSRPILITSLILVLFTLSACDDADWYKLFCEKPEGWQMKLYCMVYGPDLKDSGSGGSGNAGDTRCNSIQNSHFDPDKKTCVCNDGFVEDYFTSTGTVCFDKIASQHCKATPHSYMDPTDGNCKCDPGYKPGPVEKTATGYSSKECVPTGQTNPPTCALARAQMQRIEGMVAGARQEMAETDKVAYRLERLSIIPVVGEDDPDRARRIIEQDPSLPTYDPSLPPFPQVPRQGDERLLTSYRENRAALETGLADAAGSKLAAGKSEMDKGNCDTAASIFSAAEKVIIQYYWGFYGSSCAMRANPRVQKDAAYIVSTSLQLPAGCDCNDFTFTIMNREFNNAAVMGFLITQKPLLTIPACKAVSGELINVPDMPSKIVINHYYGKRGLFWIYYETSWLYGLVQPKLYYFPPS